MWRGLHRLGALRLLLFSCAFAFLLRAIGLIFLETYLDPWSRSAIFITRLPEFVFGISLAAWLYKPPKQTDKWLRRPITLLLAITIYILGIALSLTLLGMSVAPFMVGIGAFILLYTVLEGIMSCLTELQSFFSGWGNIPICFFSSIIH